MRRRIHVSDFNFLFTVVPAIELFLLIKLGSVIGAGNTILLIIVTGVTGAQLARFQGFGVLQRIQLDLEKGVMPTEEMINGVLILVGGILLLTPGIITDILGFLLLVPFSRSLIKALVRSRLKDAVRPVGASGTAPSRPAPKSRREFEDAEFYE